MMRRHSIMALAHSPKIVTKDLEFYYDMGNPQKSWKGAPTTNLFPTNILLATYLKSSKTLYASPFAGTHTGWSATGVANDNPRVTLYNGSISVSASTFYTLSCLYWSSNSVLDDVYLKFSDLGWPESSAYIQPFTDQAETRNGSFSITDLGDGWKFCVGTFQTLASTTTLEQLFFDVDVAGVQVFICNIQLEQNTFATPYVNGTRTNTQAILDLTGKNTLTASSLTYDANGTFSFNGSSSSIDSSTINLQQSWAFECWAKHNSITGFSFLGQGIFVANQGLHIWYTGTSTLRFGMYGNDTDYTLSTSTGIWYHYVFTYNHESPYNKQLYRNGVLINGVPVQTQSQYAGTGTVRVGATYSSGGAHANGTIASSSLYNRILTASEVNQNFNALRGRYGI